jgi:glyoxylase-like metal-dependent hydrolase (beta-lactamase superfamily II)
MIQEICQDLFCIKVPLPDSPLKYLNSYVVRTPDRSLIIDTGFNNKVCEDAMVNGLNTLGINLADTDIFITHFHADHFGLVPKLKTRTTRVFFNRQEAEILESWEGFGTMIEFAGHHGFPKPKLKSALEAHPGNKFGTDWIPMVNILSEGQILTYGDYSFTCVETPGHTLGHICLYEEDRQLLFSGDHVLGDITPNIASWSEDDHPLDDYLDSLDKIQAMDVSVCLPGHRSLIKDFDGRVEELKHHHEERANEVLEILDHKRLSAYDIAGRMTWAIRARSWEEFPLMQRWFATGEAIAHIHYVEGKGLANRVEADNMIYYEADGARL